MKFIAGVTVERVSISKIKFVLFCNPDIHIGVDLGRS